MSLHFNGSTNEPTAVYWNDKSVSNVYYNGVHVWPTAPARQYIPAYSTSDLYIKEWACAGYDSPAGTCYKSNSVILDIPAGSTSIHLEGTGFGYNGYDNIGTEIGVYFRKSGMYTSGIDYREDTDGSTTMWNYGFGALGFAYASVSVSGGSYTIDSALPAGASLVIIQILPPDVGTYQGTISSSSYFAF